GFHPATHPHPKRRHQRHRELDTADVGLAPGGNAWPQSRRLDQFPQRRVESCDREHHEPRNVLSVEESVSSLQRAPPVLAPREKRAGEGERLKASGAAEEKT